MTVEGRVGGELSRGVRAGGIVVAGGIASVAIQLVSLVVLSRLLSPADFGIVALLSVFVVLSNHLRDFGLPTAGLEQRALTAQQSSNLFWMNLGVAGLTAAVLALSAPLIATVMDEPRLTALVPAIAVVVLLGGAAAQLQVHLARAMRFRAIVVSDLVSQVLGLFVAIVLAVEGAGPWALIGQSITVALLVLFIRWIAAAWRPKFFRRGHGSRALLRVGVNYGLGDLMFFVQSNIDTFAIGTWLGTSQLGYYNRAYQLLTAPAVRLLNPMTQVVVSSINHARDRGTEPGEALVRVQFAVAGSMVLVFTFAGAVATELFPIVMGSGWDSSIEVFQILALGGAFWALDRINYWAFIAYQQSGAFLRVSIATKGLAISAILMGLTGGINGVAWGYAIAMAAAWPINLYFLGKVSDAPTMSLAVNGSVILLSGGLCYACASLVIHAAQPLPNMLSVAAAVPAALLAATAVYLVCPSTRKILREGRALLRESRERKSTC